MGSITLKLTEESASILMSLRARDAALPLQKRKAGSVSDAKFWPLT